MDNLKPIKLRDVGLYQAAGIACAAAMLVILIRRLFFDRLAKIPGPWYAKWTTIPFKIKSVAGTGPIFVDELHKKYGPVVRIGPSEVDVSDITAAKKIHRVKADFVKTDWYEGLGYTRMNVINTQSVDVHRRHRKLLTQPMSEGSLKAMEPQVEEKVRLTIQKMGEEMKTRSAVDIFKWWMFMTADVIGQLTFGETFYMLENGQVNSYIEDIRLIGAMTSIVTQLSGLMPIVYPIPLPGIGKSVKAMNGRMRDRASLKLQALRNEVESKGNKTPLLFTKVLQGLTLDGEALTEHEVIDNAEAYIIAGSDTTSNTLTYVTWALCSHAELRDRLVKELEMLPANFTNEDLKLLPFLNNCITEALRRFPVVPGGLPRYVPKEGTELAGYWLPGGTTVMTQTFSLHRNPEVFPNPDEYDPTRWENPTKEMKDSMMPFGGGSRICIGMHLAYMELRLGIAHFFRAFPHARVSTLEGMSEVDMKQALYFIASPQHHRCLIEAA
ncbi:hypothetical protein NPX13_g1939 [Xylaria arbuscula]|uniref:Cytochrome P450 n=1 Tax=Xylaria arbuscula TaxID=114810 RepID=A0A9W8TP69_9PEZI|nr:hypothetical protein NPX13_g1939 [Xylaria arbuscula]